MEFPEVIKKNHVKFPGILVLGCKISEGCSTILLSFLGSSFVLSGIFRGKVKTLKIPGEFSKTFSTILGNWDLLKRVLKKTFWSGADVPLSEEMIKSRK